MLVDFYVFHDMKVDSYVGVFVNEHIKALNEILLNEEGMHAQRFCEEFPIGFLSFLYLSITYFAEVRILS